MSLRLVMSAAHSFGHIPHHNFQWLRRIDCKSLSFQNRSLHRWNPANRALGDLTAEVQASRTVLCIGGIRQIELLGRLKRDSFDDLYYICISHVRGVGRPLFYPYDVEILDPLGRCTLKYWTKAEL